jgi:hypothetical protein
MGAAAMHGFRLVWERAVSRHDRHTLFGFDREADIKAARLAGRIVKRTLTEEEAERAGMALHYGLGAVLGLAYSLARRRRWPALQFSVLLWLCVDEAPISLSGVCDPSKKSAASHAGALAAHLIFGFVVSRICREG